MIPAWFLYLQGFAMLIMGGGLLALRPRKKSDPFHARYVNVGTMWALVCCAVGVGLLSMALGYWRWLPAATGADASAPARRHR